MEQSENSSIQEDLAAKPSVSQFTLQHGQYFVFHCHYVETETKFRLVELICPSKEVFLAIFNKRKLGAPRTWILTEEDEIYNRQPLEWNAESLPVDGPWVTCYVDATGTRGLVHRNAQGHIETKLQCAVRATAVVSSNHEPVSSTPNPMTPFPAKEPTTNPFASRSNLQHDRYFVFHLTLSQKITPFRKSGWSTIEVICPTKEVFLAIYHKVAEHSYDNDEESAFTLIMAEDDEYNQEPREWEVESLPVGGGWVTCYVDATGTRELVRRNTQGLLEVEFKPAVNHRVIDSQPSTTTMNSSAQETIQIIIFLVSSLCFLLFGYLFLSPHKIGHFLVQ